MTHETPDEVPEFSPEVSWESVAARSGQLLQQYGEADDISDRIARWRSAEGLDHLLLSYDDSVYQMTAYDPKSGELDLNVVYTAAGEVDAALTAPQWQSEFTYEEDRAELHDEISLRMVDAELRVAPGTPDYARRVADSAAGLKESTDVLSGFSLTSAGMPAAERVALRVPLPATPDSPELAGTEDILGFTFEQRRQEDGSVSLHPAYTHERRFAAAAAETTEVLERWVIESEGRISWVDIYGEHHESGEPHMLDEMNGRLRRMIELLRIEQDELE